MVIDTSAVAAILFDEPEQRRFSEAIDLAASRILSAASFVELEIVLSARKSLQRGLTLDDFLRLASITVREVTLGL